MFSGGAVRVARGDFWILKKRSQRKIWIVSGWARFLDAFGGFAPSGGIFLMFRWMAVEIEEVGFSLREELRVANRTSWFLLCFEGEAALRDL